MDSIPTTGPQGVRFRSRLEARWAAFFTLLGWNWQYEPDLGLNKWIPDFALTAGAGLLVEVKPVVAFADFGSHKRRIERSDTEQMAWIVGASLAYPSSDQDDPTVGVVGGIEWDAPNGWGWFGAQLSWVGRRLDTDVDFKTAQRCWVKAGNALQWRRM